MGTKVVSIPKSLVGYLEEMSKNVFQTGISWHVVENKWPGIREAFRGFDPETVANLTDDDKARLLRDSRIIRNRRKVDAIIDNARRMIDLEKEFGSFRSYLRSHKSFDELSRDLQKRFRFVGPMGAYHFLWSVGEDVPSWEEWSASEAAGPRVNEYAARWHRG